MEYLSKIDQLTTTINRKINSDESARDWIYGMLTHRKGPSRFNKMPEQIDTEVIALMDELEKTLYKFLEFKLNGDKMNGDKMNGIQW
jgi:hypothetical protein